MEEKEKEEKKTVEEFRACSSLACSCSPSPSRAPCARSTFPFRQSATCPVGPRGAEEPGRRRGVGRGGEGREGRDISLSLPLSLQRVRGREFGEARGQRSKKVEFDRPASMLRRASARVQIIFAELVSIRHVALEDACRQAGSRRARAPRRGPEPRGRDDGDAFGHRRRLFFSRSKDETRNFIERFKRRPYLVAGRGADRHCATCDAGDRDGRAAGARERGGAEGDGGGEGHCYLFGEL